MAIESPPFFYFSLKCVDFPSDPNKKDRQRTARPWQHNAHTHLQQWQKKLYA
jgi:hypothetical protein